MNSFTGGVFMGIGFFLLLPESKEIIESWANDNIKEQKWKEMPYSFFLSFLAYSFMLLIEKVFLTSSSLIPLVNNCDSETHSHRPSNSYASDHKSEKTIEVESEDDDDEQTFKNVISIKGRFASFMQIRNLKLSESQGIPYNLPLNRSLMRSSQILERTFHGGKINPDMDLLVNPLNSDLIKKKEKVVNIIHQHSHAIEIDKTKKLSSVTPYLLIVALCLDGLFEGIAIGVQTTWKTVSFVAFAVFLNKLSVAFGLGISLKKSKTEIRTFIRFIILFSLFCPFGIVIGYFFGETLFMKGMFLAISAGTFIYVSCSVVIVEEFALTKYRYSKYSFFFLGGLLASGIAVIASLL